MQCSVLIDLIEMVWDNGLVGYQSMHLGLGPGLHEGTWCGAEGACLLVLAKFALAAAVWI